MKLTDLKEARYHDMGYVIKVDDEHGSRYFALAGSAHGHWSFSLENARHFDKETAERLIKHLGLNTAKAIPAASAPKFLNNKNF